MNNHLIHHGGNMFTTDYNTNLQVLSDALRSEQSFEQSFNTSRRKYVYYRLQHKPASPVRCTSQ
nr:MAG TPA: hypothetical protein [Caudoviricetes sp.]